MPKSWRLTRRAERSLVDIARWTIETSGPRQARAYETDLIARCQAVAESVESSESCRSLIDPDLPEDFRLTRCGRHFIVFVDNPDAVIVIDFLHARSDLPGKLARLGDEGARRR
ncbi:type II toxin-antitoxin system RelE/ParE family toxin [Rubrimonas sp.]|uniref:type II toxin-antitoxin system RelE/ParE family toxin n=1 Tax=Rubrimonas sp. TaxID=2036015 RepID=UPI002FDD4648